MLLAAHRTACLRFDEIGQATLINLILRNYLSHNLVDQAMKFSSRANFPDHVSNNQQVSLLS
jgi:26S proteasome regulatory subunit N3